MIQHVLRTAVLAVCLALGCRAANASTVTVPAGGDLQAALDRAQPGDTILLEAGATFVGNFTLPAKNGTAYITLRSSALDSSLPGDAVRMTPAYAAALPKLRSSNTAAALATAPGAHHWRLLFLEFLANVDGFGDIITLGDGSSAQNTVNTVAHDLIVDRVYVHGDPVKGQKRGIALNSASTSILNSTIVECKRVGQDSQAIGGWNGPGPFTIVNNRLEAAGENIMFGGADPSIPNLVPSDIVFRQNFLTKPATWRGSEWSVKNLFELKNARRVLIDGNVFDTNWAAAQIGFAILLTPRNQDGGAPSSAVQDVTFRNNVVRHVGGGISILGYDDHAPSAQTARVLIVNNLWWDIGARWGGAGIFAILADGATDVTFDHNTVDHDGAAFDAYGQPFAHLAVRDNLLKHEVSSVASWQAQFVDAAGGDYRLVSSSAYRAAATDGGSLGADMSAIIAAAALAESGNASVGSPPPPANGPAPAPIPARAPVPPQLSPTTWNLTAGGASLTLQWEAASGSPDAYILEVGSAPGLTDLANFSTGSSATSFHADGVQPGRYYVRVRASTPSGVTASSNEIVVIVGTTAGTCGPSPAPPANLSAAVSGTTVSFAWAPGSDAAISYVLEAGSATGLADLMNADLASPATMLTARGVARGVYYVRVRTRNACGTSSGSNEVTVVVP